ncbi:MAG: hypothetical protein ACE5IL_06895 [Myxococcota bacterium]
MTHPPQPDAATPAARGPSRALHGLTWVLALGCFSYVYLQIARAAGREGVSVFEFLQHFFASADWLLWIALMVPYSLVFFSIDAFAISRVVTWFNAPVRFWDLLPVRASTYILALVNEQLGKGAMAVYLHRRFGVPGWEVGSSMVFVAFVELYQLMLFSALGTALHFELVQRASGMLPLDSILLGLFFGASLYAALHLAYFRGRVLATSRLRERPILTAFRRARPSHYLTLIALKAPNLLLAIAVYWVALRLFHVDIRFGTLFAFLPVIFMAAALPLPFHAGALALWAALFPDYPEVSAFAFVMHVSFVLLNACIGLVFLPRANRELFGDGEVRPDPV